MTTRLPHSWPSWLSPAFLFVVIVLLSTGPRAQGLGEVARKEAERREHASPGKRYSDRAVPENRAEAVPGPEDEQHRRAQAAETGARRERLLGEPKALETHDREHAHGPNGPATTERGATKQAAEQEWERPEGRARPPKRPSGVAAVRP